MSTLVLGLGNPIMADDGVGLRVAQEVGKQVSDPAVTVRECCAAGADLLDQVVGFTRLVVVDAVRTGAAPGTVHRLSLSDLPRRAASADMHGLGLLGVLRLGKRMGLEMPTETVIIGVEPACDGELREELSPEVERAVPQAVELVLRELQCTPCP